MTRWNRKTVREYAPYSRWDWSDPMHDALDSLAASDCELFKRRYWDRESCNGIAETCGVTGGTILGHLNRICEEVADMLD